MNKLSNQFFFLFSGFISLALLWDRRYEAARLLKADPYTSLFIIYCLISLVWSKDRSSTFLHGMFLICNLCVCLKLISQYDLAGRIQMIKGVFILVEGQALAKSLKLSIRDTLVQSVNP